MVWLKRITDYGEQLWFWMKTHINKMCHGMSTSGFYVCPAKKRIRSHSHIPSPYLTALIQYRISTKNQNILFLCVWTVSIGK